MCPANHCFDRAREGYVNLLPPHRKRSRDPGDNREMINARRRVHSARHYQPLADRMVLLLNENIRQGARLLDLGCGEGYYSGELIQRLAGTRLHAVDISRTAVKLAARACPEGEFAVASSVAVPLADATVDAAFSVFAPTDAAELKRLLAPGGCFLNVSPGPGHLWELRQVLYSQPRPHPTPTAQLEGFEAARQQSLAFTLELQGQQLQDVIAMTPYAYSARREHKQQLAELQSMRLQADFVLSLHRRLRT